MRRAAEALKTWPILKRDVFTRGDPEATLVVSHRRLEGDLRGLMAAYLQPRARGVDRAYRPAPAEAYRLDDARDRLRSMLPRLIEWTALSQVAPSAASGCAGGGPSRASYVASTLSAGLELVREGELQASQSAPFEEIFLRAAPQSR
jgi:segregation and condensation protein A